MKWIDVSRGFWEDTVYKASLDEQCSRGHHLWDVTQDKDHALCKNCGQQHTIITKIDWDVEKERRSNYYKKRKALQQGQKYYL